MSIYKLEAGTAQHVGNRPRQNDRAALFTGSMAPGYVLAVVGDGGAANATGAEQLLHTSKQLFDEFRVGDAPSVERIDQLLRAIAQETHEVLLMNPLPDAADARSTMALLMLTPDHRAVWATVGDTRLYRFANGVPAEKTDDAAYIDYLMATDGLAEDAARRHRGTRLLNNAMGNRLKAPFVSLGSHSGLHAGDGFLLCTDGLWQYFADNELAAAVSRRTPRQAAELLIGKASERARGQGDNCTMAILRLVPPLA